MSGANACGHKICGRHDTTAESEMKNDPLGTRKVVSAAEHRAQRTATKMYTLMCTHTRTHMRTHTSSKVSAHTAEQSRACERAH